MFFLGVALGAAGHDLLGVQRTVAMATLMAAILVGVTKTPLGSTLVVAEIAGLRLLPPVLLASLVALFLTSRVSMIDSQREREGAFGAPSMDEPGGAAAPPPVPGLGPDGATGGGPTPTRRRPASGSAPT
jgi:H+/Cl- antiporter ClcA